MGIFFIPYATDAPLYYLPFVTIGMIVLNTVLYIGAAMGVLPQPEAWMLMYGQGLHPWQWLSANFMHFDFGHLFGNMMFLWVYGLITEGKLGWWRFLGFYLFIAVAFGALQQIFALGYGGPVTGGMGASAVIWGLLGMALVWAPRNEVNFVGFYLIFVMFRLFFFNVSVLALAMFFACWEGILFLMESSIVSSAAAHLLGGALGFGVGVFLLRRGVVDCEKWDLISVLRGNEGSYAEIRERLESRDRLRREEAEKQRKLLEAAREQVGVYLGAGNPAAAFLLYTKMAGVGPGLQLPEHELLAIIQGLLRAQRPADVLPLMEEYVQRFPDKAARVRLRLAQIYLQARKQPEAALAHLDPPPGGALPADLEALRQRMHKQALALQATSDADLDVQR